MLSYTLAPTGSTGNNTHAGISGLERAAKLAVEFIVEAVGATPTVTVIPQGSFDGVTWFNLAVAGTDASAPAASAAGFAVTTVSTTYKFVIGSGSVEGLDDGYLFIPKLRLQTAANTNVTYRANLYRMDDC